MEHDPPLHVSEPLQNRLSSHGDELLRCEHVPVPLHWSFVQTLPSLVHGVPASVLLEPHVPPPLQVLSVHGLPSSLHGVP